MSAAELRVPVLLGPVPCIGCAAEKRAPAPMPLAHVDGHERAYMFFAPRPFADADDSQVGISANRVLYWTPCRADFQLSDLRAHAWTFSIPIFFYLVDAAVEADATQVVVPGASCPPL